MGPVKGKERRQQQHHATAVERERLSDGKEELSLAAPIACNVTISP